jgi:hypothetical protein
MIACRVFAGAFAAKILSPGAWAGKRRVASIARERPGPDDSDGIEAGCHSNRRASRMTSVPPDTGPSLHRRRDAGVDVSPIRTVATLRRASGESRFARYPTATAASGATSSSPTERGNEKHDSEKNSL